MVGKMMRFYIAKTLTLHRATTLIPHSIHRRFSSNQQSRTQHNLASHSGKSAFICTVTTTFCSLSEEHTTRSNSISSGRSTPHHTTRASHVVRSGTNNFDEGDLVEIEFPAAHSETTASPQYRSRSDSLASDASARGQRSRAGR